jgi:thiol-disulfide isomerase/thioredoxin
MNLRLGDRARRLSLLALVMFWAVGAQGAEDQRGSDGPAEATRMAVIGLDDWPTILAAQRPDIVVVDLWASWCVSCIERFPEMVAMADRHADRPVRFLTLNLDDPRDQEGIDWSNAFLDRIGADFPNYHLDENLTVSFEALDLLAIPVVLIYDGNGVERYRLTNDDPNNQFDEADIEAAVRALLAERA